MMNLSVPSSATACGAAAQLAGLRSLFCCRTKPSDGDGQRITAALVEVSRMVSSGASGLCTANSDQNPPAREKYPPDVGCQWAAVCPSVPSNKDLPSLPDLPARGMVNRSVEPF